MTIAQIENNIIKLLKNLSVPQSGSDNFIFEFLLAYRQAKATITRLKNGNLN